MPLDFSDPALRRYFTEKYESENKKSLLWFLKHKEEVERCAKFPETYKGLTSEDIARKTLQLTVPIIKQDFKNSIVNKRKKLINVVVPVKRIKEEPVMKPVDSTESKILYVTLPEGGRCNYLNIRKRKLPEEKYNFCPTTSSVYGWKLSDCHSVSKQRCGRFDAFSHAFGRLSGPQPNPPHYRNPQTAFTICKCTSWASQ